MNQLHFFQRNEPEPAKVNRFELRDYQREADAAIDRTLAEHRSALLVLPVGGGKTVVFASQAAKRNGALVLVHRDILLRQAAEKLEQVTGKQIAIEKGELRAFESPYVVASVQSLHPERLVAFKRRFESFPLIVIDEAHRAIAKGYRNVLDAFPESKVLGVTATPDRSDGVAMRNVFESVAYDYSLPQATDDGWLTPLRWIPVSADIDLSGVRVVGSGADRDFDQRELDNAIVKEAGRIAQSASRAVESSNNPTGRVVVFAPGVKTAHAGAAALNETKPGCAMVVDGAMDDLIKRRTIERFMAGEFQYLFNCAVLIEGYDDPTLFAVFDASPTKSRLRAVQKWGRITRLWPMGIHTLHTAAERRAAIATSPKPWATVFDLVSNSSEHDVVIDAIDILGGKDLPPEVAKAAKRIIRESGGTAKDAIQAAADDIESKRKRAAAARHLAQATSVTMGKPRSVFERAGLEFIKRKQVPGRPQEAITPKMWGLLKKRGIPFPRDCTIPQFKRLLSLDRKQEAKGFCRLGGVEWLRMYGVDGWKLPSATAKRIRDAIRANGRKLTAEELAPLMERTPGED